MIIEHLPKHSATNRKGATMNRNTLFAVLSLALALTSASAQQPSASETPNMPARNPWLADSVYPITHFNSAQTDSVPHAGPTKGRKLTAADIKTVPTVFTSNPTVKKVGGETILIGKRRQWNP